MFSTVYLCFIFNWFLFRFYRLHFRFSSNLKTKETIKKCNRVKLEQIDWFSFRFWFCQNFQTNATVFLSNSFLIILHHLLLFFWYLQRCFSPHLTFDLVSNLFVAFVFIFDLHLLSSGHATFIHAHQHVRTHDLNESNSKGFHLVPVLLLLLLALVQILLLLL